MGVVNHDLSVVIASLGGDVLARTIESINSGVMIPYEIIIVVPKKNATLLPNDTRANVRYELVNFQGQVAQRVHGFQLSKCNFVIQSDDDIIYDKFCIKALFDASISYQLPLAVGPELRHVSSRNSIYQYRNSIFIKLYEAIFRRNRIVNKMGKLNKWGSCYGIDPAYFNDKLISTQWLAGGCVIHHKNSLILENYFPYPGKAYGEDLMHSVLLSNNGVSLFVVKDAVCYIDLPEYMNKFSSLLGDYRCRLHINKMRKIELYTVYLWFIVKLLSMLVNKVLHPFKT